MVRNGIFRCVRPVAAAGRCLPGAACALALAISLAGCVDQYPERSQARGGTPRVAVTSVVLAEVCDRLGADVAGVPQTGADLPASAEGATVIGGAMAPDLEALRTLHADYALAPLTLVNDLQPKFASIAQPSIFADLKSPAGLYDSVDYVGRVLGREAEAAALRADYEAFLTEYAATAPAERPTVLILMGVPGSYVVATERSYVGSLVALAGGQNLYADESEEFIKVGAEDMVGRDPDIILRASHGLPDQVAAMFAEEFAENDIWRHFRAVQEGRVYDLPSDLFGMSADFSYPEALGLLRDVLAADEPADLPDAASLR